MAENEMMDMEEPSILSKANGSCDIWATVL